MIQKFLSTVKFRENHIFSLVIFEYVIYGILNFMKRFAENSVVGYVQKALEQASLAISQPSTSSIHTTSIRISDDVKRFLENFGDALGLSWQQTTILVLRSVMTANINTIPGIYHRLHEVLAWHQLDPVDASTLLQPWGFTLDVLANTDATLNRLNHAAVEFISKTFGVHRDYLLNLEQRPQIQHDRWYKTPETVARRYLQLREAGLNPRVLFLADGSDKNEAFLNSDDAPPVYVAVAIEQTNIIPNTNRTYKTYEYYGYDRWNYDYCRWDLKHLIRFAETCSGLSGLSGVTISKDGMSALVENRIHIADVIQNHNKRMEWNPEFYVTNNPNVAREIKEFETVISEYSKTLLPSFLEGKNATF
jgi:hypothetical protein